MRPGTNHICVMAQGGSGTELNQKALPESVETHQLGHTADVKFVRIIKAMRGFGSSFRRCFQGT